MNSEKKLIKNTLIYTVGNFGSKILSYIMVLVYSYYISPDNLGYYDLVITTIAMLQPIIMLSMNDGAYRFLINSNIEEKKKVLGSSFKFILLTTVISNIILAIYSKTAALNYALWIGLYMSTTILYVYFQDCIRGLENNKLYAGIGILNSALLLFFEIVGLIFLKLGVVSLIAGKALANLVCIVVILFSQSELKNVFSYTFDKSTFRELIRYSSPLVPNAVCWWVVNSSSRYIILFSMGTAFNGIFSMANKFPTIITTITGIFYLAWQQSAIQEYNSSNRDRFFSSIFDKYSGLLFSLVALAIPATKILFEIFVAAEYESSWMYTGFLYLAAVFSSLSSFLGMGYQISKETGRSVVTTVFAAIINILITLSLIRYIGLQAASFSSFGAYLFLFFIRLKHTRRYFVLKVKWVKLGLLLGYTLLSMALTFISDSLIVSWIQCFGAFGIMLYSNRELLTPIIRRVKRCSNG